MKIQCVNKSTVVGPDEFLTMVVACAEQLRNHVAPAWEIVSPEVEACLDGAVDPNAYEMVLFDTSDQPDALGYHDFDSQGKPRGFVFAKTTIENSGNVSTTLSHELGEMLIDPNCTLWSQTPDGNLRAYELCDAVEADEYEIMVGDVAVKVSNFLLPGYFSAIPIPGRRTDYLDKLSGQIAPARTPGGYDIVVTSAGQPTQEFSRHMAALPNWKLAMKTHSGSRTAKRVAFAGKGNAK